MKFVELDKSHFPLLAKHYVETYNAPPWNDQWTETLAAEKLGELMDCRGAFGLELAHAPRNKQTAENIGGLFIKYNVIFEMLRNDNNMGKKLAGESIKLTIEFTSECFKPSLIYI